MRPREVYQSIPRREPLQEDILGHRKVRDEVALPVDDGDACGDRIPRRAENEVSIFEFERPAVGSVSPGVQRSGRVSRFAFFTRSRTNFRDADPQQTAGAETA
jgi:hypothetical protein